MPDINLILLEAAFLAVSVLYSVTGHGGASGYIAVMALLGIAPHEIKPMALGLNIIVSLIATIQFYRAGHFNKALFLPFALASAPLALVGGYIQLPAASFKILLGIALLFAALRLYPRTTFDQPKTIKHWALPAVIGMAIGFISGLLGIGGGIFLTPLLLLMQWANPRQAAAVSAPFILVNSLAGLTGYLSHNAILPEHFVLSGLVVMLGGLIGSYLGSRKLHMKTITRILSAVILLAGLKLCLT